jgi:peptidoglycan L-alanyl-D-glutamate endopeptidase CwlK
MQLLARCAALEIDLLITDVWRSTEDQAAIYAQGRTAPGRIVTYARPGTSKHEHTEQGQPASLAFDVAFVSERSRDGTPTSVEWSGPWDVVGAIGEWCGLKWGGRWVRPDRPHFEVEH